MQKNDTFKERIISMQKNFPTIDFIETGKRIHQYMNEQGLSVKDVQEYMGFSSPQSVYYWLRGRSLPNIDNLYALSELLKVPIDEIICGNREYLPKFNMKTARQYHRLKAYVLFISQICNVTDEPFATLEF